jgi:nucleotide-binding universal stress UspA family protein
MPADARPGTVQPGSTIDGFTVGARLHDSAMGAIYRVTKPGVTGPLIMKVPRVGADEPSESVIGFETEATIVPALSGPHVPAFVAAGDLARTPYLVTAWTEGRTLEELLEGAPLPPDEVARIGAAVADALHSVHQQGAVHLDVKPSNLVLRADGTVVVIDFGFAHHARYPDLLAEETRFGAGSAPYVSPEQLLGTREDPRSDVFALGVVLYELATRRLPYGEPDTDVRNRFWIEPVPPRVLAEAVPPWLQEIILRCIEPRAELRYQSAAHVAFDLRHPEQVQLTVRATRTTRAGVLAHLARFLRARREYGARLRSPAVLLSQTPIVLVAVDTAHMDDERHPAIHLALSQILTPSKDFRLICLTVIRPPATPFDHLVRLRHWVEPLRLPSHRLSLHAIESDTPADVIVELARHNNVDLVILGAPAEGGRAWSQSVASTVSAKARCSVHLVRVPRR